MLKRLAVALIAACALRASAADPADASALRGTVDKTAKDTLGTEGARVFREAATWDAFRETLKAHGWKERAGNALTKVDFTKSMVVCVFQHGDEQNAFVVKGASSDGKEAKLEIGMSYTIYKSHQETPGNWKFIAVTLPAAPKVTASVSVFTPKNATANDTLEKALLDWSVTLEDGDAVGSLGGEIKPRSATVKAGDDIELTFTLKLAPASVGADHVFSAARDTVRVWDGKYSEGYRNHAFLVTTPDGKTTLLRRAVQMDWDKNIPHLEDVTTNRAYLLPNWVEGDDFKSLKALGLDTSKPGTYRVTGVYMEAADGEGAWGGEFFTNTITVEVK